MGIYDRDYYRDEGRSSLSRNWSAVWVLIAINVVIFVADQVSDGNWLSSNMRLQANLGHHLGRFWTLLTYGFAHDPHSIQHIGFNMFGLWLFGMDVERMYGREKFIRLYLSLVVCSGFVWVLIEAASHQQASVIGASGAIMGIMAVYVLNFPNRMFLFFFAIPMPAWVLGLLYFGWDIFGAVSPTDNVAHAAHIAGAIFGVIFVRTGWYLGRLIPSTLPQWMKFNRPKLRVHSERDEPQSQRDVQKRVDEILAKISREGEASLTADERRELEDLSRRIRHGR